MSNHEITFIEMFAGVGGVRLGLERANQESGQNVEGTIRDRLQSKGDIASSLRKGNREDRRKRPHHKNRLEKANQICRKHRDSKEGNKGTGTSLKSSQTTSKSVRSIGNQPNPVIPGNSRKIQYRCVWANDWEQADFKWKKNKKTGKLEWKGTKNQSGKIYTKHWNDGTYVDADIKTIDADSIPDHTLLTAGFPCPTFSVAGKRKGFKDARGTLFFDIARVAEAKRPRLLLLENVKGLLSHDEGLTFQIILESLAKLGYTLEWQVLNSKHYGVPQNRERVFIVGHLRGKGSRQIFPVGQSSEITDRRYSEKQVANALQSPGHASGNYRGMSMIQVGNIAESGHDSVWGRVYDPNGLARTVTFGGGVGAKTGLYAVLTPDRPKKRQHGRRFKKDGDPMFTLTGQDIHGVAIQDFNQDGNIYTKKDSSALRNPKASQSNLLNDGFRIRRLTPTECERLQGFPDGWTEGVSDTQRYKCLGNAITTNVVEYLGRRIKEICFGD